MRKLTLLSVSLLGLLFANCSNDSSDLSADQPNAKIYGEKVPGINAQLPEAWEMVIENNLLTKVIKPGTNNSSTLEYSNGHLAIVSQSTGQDELSYDGQGRISVITSSNASGVMVNTRTFDYSNPALIQETYNAYNASGTITQTFVKFIKIENGNVVESYDQNDSQHNTYQYDSKSNVFSAVNNLNELVLYYSSTTDKVNANNRVSGTSVFRFNGNVMNTVIYTYINQYNDQQKIVSSSYIQNGENQYQLKYTY